MSSYVFEIYRFSAIDFNRFEMLKGSGECIVREYIFKHLLLLWNNASVIYLHSWYFLTAAAQSFPPVSWTKAVSKDRDSSKTTLYRTYRGEKIHPLRSVKVTHSHKHVKHIYRAPFCITSSHRQNTHTFQWRQTRACSSCDPLESSYKMLSPPASPGMDCFLQHTHTQITPPFTNTAFMAKIAD